MKYFRVLESDDAVAEAPDDVVGDSVITERKDAWEVLPFRLVEGAPLDLLPTDAGWALCSERLRRALDAQLGKSDSPLWLPVDVFCALSVIERYYVLWFGQQDAVLHEASYVRGKLARYVLSRELLGSHRVFTAYPECSILFLHEDVRAALVRERLTGLEFSPLPVR